MRKHTRRRVTIPLPPRGLRPMLDRGQLRDLALAHISNLDALARGGADGTTLWHAVEAAFTWSRVAQLLGAAFGAILGARGSVLAQVAGATSLGAGAGSAANAGLTQRQIIERCLANRGFATLN